METLHTITFKFVFIYCHIPMFTGKVVILAEMMCVISRLKCLHESWHDVAIAREWDREDTVRMPRGDLINWSRREPLCVIFPAESCKRRYAAAAGIDTRRAGKTAPRQIRWAFLGGDAAIYTFACSLRISANKETTHFFYKMSKIKTDPGMDRDSSEH